MTLQNANSLNDQLEEIKQRFAAGDITPQDAIVAVLDATEAAPDTTARISGINLVKTLMLKDEIVAERTALYEGGMSFTDFQQNHAGRLSLKPETLRPSITNIQAAQFLTRAVDTYFRKPCGEAENQYSRIEAFYVAANANNEGSPAEIAAGLRDALERFVPNTKSVSHDDPHLGSRTIRHPFRDQADAFVASLPAERPQVVVPFKKPATEPADKVLEFIA